MTEGRARYLTLGQRAWWLAGVFVLIVIAVFPLRTTFAANGVLVVPFMAVAALVAWLGYRWWGNFVGEPVTSEECQRRLAADMLARPLLLDVLLAWPIFGLQPFVPVVVGESVRWSHVLVATPIALAGSWLYVTWMRRRAARQLAKST